MTAPLVDPADPDAMRLFMAACSMAPALYGARCDAYALRDAVPWARLAMAEKDRYIVRAMELLKTFAPVPLPGREIVTGLGGKIIGGIHPSGRTPCR